MAAVSAGGRQCHSAARVRSVAGRQPGQGPAVANEGDHLRRSREHHVGSVIKKRRKRMAKKKHRKLLKKTRVQRRNKK